MAKAKIPSGTPKDDDLFAPDPLTGQRPLTQLEQSFLIAREQPKGDEIAVIHSLFAHCGLPRSKVQGDVFERRSGEAWLIVQAGYAATGPKGKLEKQMVPYGAIPRLMLAHMTTHALRHKSREIPLGRSASDFLRQLGMDSGGRRHITLRNQATALSSCRMLMGYQGRQINSQPVSEFELWQPGSGPQHSLWPGVIVLSTDFYESLQDACMPIDMRVMLNLKDSPMAMDVFTWLAHRLYRIEGGRPTLLHWPAIKAQFGQEYADAKDFKKQFRVALRRVLMQYPKARVQSVAGGLLLAKSPPPVAPRVILPSR